MTGCSIYRTTGFNAGVASSDVPAARAPGRSAIVEDGAAPLTFADLARQSTAVAARLSAARFGPRAAPAVGGSPRGRGAGPAGDGSPRGRGAGPAGDGSARGRGAGPGRVVGVLAPAGRLAAIAHCGVLKAGAISLPLVPLLGDAAIRHRLSDAGAEVVLATPELASRVTDRPVILLDDAMLADGPAAPADTAADDPALILYTSGSTGPPKGAVLPHRVIAARRVPLELLHGPFGPGDVFWTPADWMWVGSVVDAVLGPLSLGCTVMTYPRMRFDPAVAAEQLVRHGVTCAFVPATALRQLAELPRAAWDGHRLRSIHSGGEPLTADAAAWARETLGVEIAQIYGMTEASFLVADDAGVEGSIGRPLPGQDVRVLDAAGAAVGPGEIGELCVAASSPSLFLGYHGRPAETAARFRDGWFRTGDLARCDAEGRLYFVGRSDDLITTAGHRIGPGEIEDVLRTHARVKDVIVVGEADIERGQRIKAVVQLRDGEPVPALTGELQDLVRAQVGRHAYPRSVEYVAEFPRTVTGKVRRDLLRLAPEDR